MAQIIYFPHNAKPLVGTRPFKQWAATCPCHAEHLILNVNRMSNLGFLLIDTTRKQSFLGNHELPQRTNQTAKKYTFSMAVVTEYQYTNKVVSRYILLFHGYYYILFYYQEYKCTYGINLYWFCKIHSLAEPFEPSVKIMLFDKLFAFKL